MIAMFSDIYYYNDRETIKRVNDFCMATGADWAETFYNPDAWEKFKAWEAKGEIYHDKK